VNAYSGTPNYRCWWNIPALPKFNTKNPEVRRYLMSVGEYWMRKGIDGWRLDVPNEIDDDSFWQEFRLRIKAINPEAYIVGEIWENPDRWLQGDQFDGVMNYRLRRLLAEFFFPEGMHHKENISSGEPESMSGSVESGNVAEFCRRVETFSAVRSFGSALNLLGSHDTPRIATIGQGCEDEQLMVWALLLFLPGSFCLYYGDDIGLAGR
jgi:glycosidase